MKAGYNGSGNQRCKCKECGKYYTIDPKRHEYLKKTRELAIRMYYGGISSRGVGKILKMNKSRTQTRENPYIMTMVSRKPRQIVGHVVSRNKSFRTIQRMVDAAPEAEYYCTDGYFGYLVQHCQINGEYFLFSFCHYWCIIVFTKISKVIILCERKQLIPFQFYPMR